MTTPNTKHDLPVKSCDNCRHKKLRAGAEPCRTCKTVIHPVTYYIPSKWLPTQKKNQ